jgi:hypothetical protein
MIDDFGFGILLLAVIGIFLVGCVWRMGRGSHVSRDNSPPFE